MTNTDRAFWNGKFAGTIRFLQMLGPVHPALSKVLEEYDQLMEGNGS